MRQMTMLEFLQADIKDIKDNETIVITDSPKPILITNDAELAKQWQEFWKHYPLSDAKH